MRGLRQISLLFWSELLSLPGGGALLAGLCLLGPSGGPGTQDLSGQAEESHAKGMRAVHSPAAGLSPRLFLFLLPCRAEAQGGAGSPPQPVKPAADPGHSLGSRLPEASGCGHVVPPLKPGSSCCVVSR